MRVFMSSATVDEVLIRRDGRAGRITMNRPKALNALTHGMVQRIWDALGAWKDDPAVELVLLDGTGDKALCAGGDVISLYESRASGSGLARKFWREEYQLNALIARYPKLYVALQDGIVMGGGIGLSSHGRFRVVTERSMLAMPETGIGLIPDVGGTWLLSHAQGELGTYLALTGARMSGSDAIQAGLSGSFVSSKNLEALKAQLVDPKGGAVEEVIEEAEEPVPNSVLAADRAKIDQWFGFDSVEEIVAALSTTTDQLAQKTKAELARKSPLALKTTLAALRRARKLGSLEEALNVEYRLVLRLFEHGEFPEGIRALLVDKDKAPKWNPPQLAEVKLEMVAPLFAPLAAHDELGLMPPR
jgi:enoyl-CoA hydratase